MSPADAARMQMMQDLEIEMMSDLYNRMTQACHKKCVPPRYSEPDLGMHYYTVPILAMATGLNVCCCYFVCAGKGESVCLDRCVSKYLDIHERIGKKLTAMSMQDEDLLKKLAN